MMLSNSDKRNSLGKTKMKQADCQHVSKAQGSYLGNKQYNIIANQPRFYRNRYLDSIIYMLSLII